MNVEQLHQRLPMNCGERTFGQNARQLFYGAHISRGVSARCVLRIRASSFKHHANDRLGVFAHE